jgi:hypothetical protein
MNRDDRREERRTARNAGQRGRPWTPARVAPKKTVTTSTDDGVGGRERDLYREDGGEG